MYVCICILKEWRFLYLINCHLGGNVTGPFFVLFTFLEMSFSSLPYTHSLSLSYFLLSLWCQFKHNWLQTTLDQGHIFFAHRSILCTMPGTQYVLNKYLLSQWVDKRKFASMVKRKCVLEKKNQFKLSLLYLSSLIILGKRNILNVEDLDRWIKLNVGKSKSPHLEILSLSLWQLWKKYTMFVAWYYQHIFISRFNCTA